MIDVGALSRWCVYLAEAGGDVVRAVVDSGKLNTVDKGAGTGEFDPSTEADKRTQALIVGGLRRQFPSLVVIGEEDQVDSAHVDLPPTLPERYETLEYFAADRWPANLGVRADSQVCVWVDPVDGTTELTKDNLESVSVLIGVAVDGSASFGVIHEPFNGRTLYAAVGHPDHSQRPAQPRKRASENVVVTSSSHFDASLAAYFANLNPQPARIVQAGGCGHKAVLVIDGLADAYLYPRPGTKKWDSCAPDAILRAVGGRLTDVYGDDLRYGADAAHANRDGIICTLHADHDLYVLARPQ
ncbi:3'(2'),5'-bisphosphate nucleotidase 1 [Plasmodiophora brassicae]